MHKFHSHALGNRVDHNLQARDMDEHCRHHACHSCGFASPARSNSEEVVGVTLPATFFAHAFHTTVVLVSKNVEQCATDHLLVQNALELKPRCALEKTKHSCLNLAQTFIAGLCFRVVEAIGEIS